MLMRFFKRLRYGIALNHALYELKKYNCAILGATDWSGDKAIYIINELLERKFDVTVEQFDGNRYRRFINVRPGTGTYKFNRSELNMPIPTYSGAHNHF